MAKEIRLKTAQKRAEETKELFGKLKALNIFGVFPKEAMDLIMDYLKNGTSCYKKIPWPEMDRTIELLLNSKEHIVNQCNLLRN